MSTTTFSSEKCFLLFVSIISWANAASLSGYYGTQGQDALVPTIDSGKRCPYDKISYVVGSQKVAWFQAFILCKQSGMELASITSAEEEEALERHLKISGVKNDHTESFWLGATRHGAAGSDFVWLAFGTPVIYRKFALNQPDNAGNTDNCLELFANGQDNFSWNDNKCDKKAGFICQTRC